MYDSSLRGDCRYLKLRREVNIPTIPNACGGNATIENCQKACRHCNASKGSGDVPKSPPLDYKDKWPPEHWNRPG